MQKHLDAQSDDYWRTLPKVPGTLELHPLFAEAAQPGSGVLDLGCGPGRTLEAVDPAFGPRLGMDLNSAALAGAAASGTAAYACADLRDLPLRNRSFRIGTMLAVLTIIPTAGDRLRVLSEARRVLDGPLFVSDFLRTPENPTYKARYEKGLAETGEAGSFVVRRGDERLFVAHHFTVKELGGLLEKAGFRMERTLEKQVRTRTGNVINGIECAAAPV